MTYNHCQIYILSYYKNSAIQTSILVITLILVYKSLYFSVAVMRADVMSGSRTECPAFWTTINSDSGIL